MYLKKKIIGIIQIHWDVEDPEDSKRAAQEQSSLTSHGWVITSSSVGKCVLSKEASVNG